jgi:hypothetical protein
MNHQFGRKTTGWEMAVSGKGRRKIVVGGRAYIWWVRDNDPEFNAASTSALMVVSSEGRFGVRFFLGQPPERRFLIVLGPEFERIPDAGGPWIRVRCPDWQVGADVTPAIVRRLIEWCMSPDHEIVRVNYFGYPEELVRASGSRAGLLMDGISRS